MAEQVAVSDDAGLVDLATLLLPLAELILIVPSLCVAEIMRLRELKPIDPAPPWLYGMLQWRQFRVPVISFEAMNGEDAPDFGSGSRIVLLSTVDDPRDLPYLGVMTRGVPHLLRITPEDLGPGPQGDAGPAALQRVTVFGQQAAIPDLDYIQSQLISHLSAATSE